MIRRISIALAVGIFLCLTSMAGVRGTWRGMVFETIGDAEDSDVCSLVDGSGATGDIIVPPAIYIETEDGGSLRTHPVSIGNYAFKDNTAITSASFNKNINLVGHGAFIGCTNLKNLTFSRYEAAPLLEGTPFDEALYADCTLHYGHDCNAYQTEEGWKEFANRIQLNPVVEYKGVFYELFPEKDYPDNYISAILYDMSDIEQETYEIEEYIEGTKYHYGFIYVNGVGDYAAYANPWLKHFRTNYFHGTEYASFGNYTFGECHNLADIYVFQINKFGEGCFMNCPKLTKMDMFRVPDDSFKSLPAHVFDGCKSLDFPYLNRATSFGDYALRDYNLTSLTVKKNYTFGTGSFCTPTLMSVTCESPDPYPTDGPVFSQETYDNAPLYVHYSSVEKYAESEPNWCNFRNILPADVPENFLHYEINPDGETCTLKDAHSWRSDDNRLVLPSLVTLTDPEGNPKTYTLTDIAYHAFYGNKNIRALVVPETVTTVGESMLEDCSNIVEVSILGPVTVLPHDVFAKCSSLANLSLPPTVTEFGDWAFTCCYNLKDFPYAPNLEIIGDRVFYACESLTSVTLPDKVKSVGERVFSDCTKLTSLTVSSKIEKWGNCAFGDTPGLKSFVGLDGLTEIGPACFYHPPLDYDKNLKSVTLPPSLTKIGKEAFKETSLTEMTLYCKQPPVVEQDGMAISNSSALTLKVPEDLVDMYREDDFWGKYKIEGLAPIATDSNGCVYRATRNGAAVELIDGSACKGDLFITGNLQLTIDGSLGNYMLNSIAEGAFADNKDLTGITFDNITFSYLPERCFAGCTALSQVMLPMNLNIIREHCFDGCEALETILLPEQLGAVEASAFANCPALEQITLAGYHTVPSCDASAFDTQTFDNARLRLCQYELDYSKSHGYAWTEFKNIEILEPDLEAGGVVYYPLPGTLEAKVSVSPDASGAVEIPKAVSLKQSLFYHVYNVTGIEPRAFEGNGSITSVTVPSVKGITVGERAFSGCEALTSVNLPYELTELEEGLFAACSALKDVELSSQMVSIGAEAFNGCSALEHLDVPSLISTIGERAFAGCSSLRNLMLPVALREIAPRLMEGCTSLRNIIVPLQVETIGDMAFSGCSSLANIILPASLRKIDSEAFSGCNAIENIKCFGTEPCELVENAFSTDAYHNASLYVPEGGSRLAYATAPGWKNFFSIFEYKEDSGAEDIVIGTDGLPTEIYDLSGRRLSGNPAPGIYIVRTTQGFRKVKL